MMFSVPSGSDNEPFFFGPPEEHLFGCINSPGNAYLRQSGVVICYPMGQEYLRSHRACRQLAVRLAKVGFPVLRFDYYGTGDSGGDSEDARIHRWLADIELAVQELRNRAGVQEVSLVGLRLGATLATIFAARQTQTLSLVLWEPVISGRDYLDELTARHDEALAFFYARPKTAQGDIRAKEVLGFVLTDNMQADLTELDLLSLHESLAPRVFLVEGEESIATKALMNHFRAMGTDLVYRQISSPKIWSEDPDKALVPHHTLESVVSWLSEVTR